jgi:hypothetical protein
MLATIKALFDVDWVVESTRTVKTQQAQEIISAVEALNFFRAMEDQSRLRTIAYFCSLLSL